jgi:ATP-dependent Clp protease protease subunit
MLSIPGVIWRDSNGTERAVDITTRLLRDRIVMCTGEITEELAESIVAQLLYLEAENKDKPIKMFVNSQGGSCLAGLSIISCMETISCPVHTVISGLAASMGIVIAASGEKGERSIYPLSRVMIHQCSGGQHGNIQDVRTSYKEMEKVNDILMEQLAKCCDKDIETVRNDCQRDTWYGPEEIIEYGLVDKVVKSHK